MGKHLTESDYENAAVELGVDLACIKAVAEVESAGDGFLPGGLPKILFERHWFSKLTRRRFDSSHPDISSETPGGYKGGTAEWDRLQKAMALDRTAALMSASWGKFQIMGLNFAACGYPTVELFVEAMTAAEYNHLLAFVAFVQSKELDDELQRHDWAGFARGYNGAAYKKNHYDNKLAAAYAKHGGSHTGATPEAEPVSLPPVPGDIHLALPTRTPPLGDAPPPAVVSGPDEPPAQFSLNGNKALWTNVTAQLGGVGTGVIALFQNNRLLLILAASLMALFAILWFTRGIITDVQRMKHGADPSKFNVR